MAPSEYILIITIGETRAIIIEVDWVMLIRVSR